MDFVDACDLFHLQDLVESVIEKPEAKVKRMLDMCETEVTL